VGYLIAGIALGPFTPGIVADANFAAEIGDLKREGADAVVIGEHELAAAMAEYALSCAKTDTERANEPKTQQKTKTP